MEIKTFQQLKLFLSDFNNREFAFDTESEDGLDYLKMTLAGFSLYDGEKSCYVNCYQNPEYNEIISYFTKFIQTYKPTLIMSNAVYDMKILYKHFGISEGFNPVCTVVAEKLISDTEYNYGLKELTQVKLGRSVVDFKTASQYGFNSPQFISYAEADAVNVWDVWQIQKEELKRENQTYLFEQVEMPFQFVLRDMEINGVLVDQTELENLAGETIKRIYDIEEQMLRVFNKTHTLQQGLYDKKEFVSSPVNFNSPKVLIQLIESLGLEITEKTDSGEKSVGKETLLELKDKHKFIELLQTYKKLQKLQSTYVENLRNVDKDGRIRPTYNLVRSGRVTCSPLQQMPNPKKEENKEIGLNFRKVLIPTKGYKFVCADFSGQELRVGAHVCNCKNLIKAFNENKDPHLMTANDVFSLGLSEQQLTQGTPEYKDAKKKYESYRDKGKNCLNFPIMYGTTAGGISKRQGVSYKEAYKWIDSFFETYPEIKQTMDWVKEQLSKYGYIEDMMGRRRRYPDYKNAAKREKEFNERSAFNHLIQGFSASMAKIAATKVLEICKKYFVKFIMFVHDELVFEVKDEFVDDFVKELKPIMCGCVSLKVPIEVDISIKTTF